MKQFDLKETKNIHFVGIKGVAMTSLAILAKERGMIVTGSDIAQEFPTDVLLKKFSITSFIGFNPKNIQDTLDLVVYTGAHGGSTNAEVVAAKEQGIQTLSHGKALGEFMQGKKAISVAGTHGKTTTSAMIATVLTKGDYDPSFTVGCGEIFALGVPAHNGSGEYFVAEADEYVTDPLADTTPRFLWHRPHVAVITNIEFDHPDVFVDIAQVKQAFLAFSKKITKKGFIVCGVNSKNVRDILSDIHCPIVTFGVTHDAEFQARDIVFSQKKTQFSLLHQGKKLETITLQVPGKHNVENALAAIATLFNLRVPLAKIKSGLQKFTGTKRRFEFVTEYKNVRFYDDYAHHPTEITATLSAMHESFPKSRVIAIFQPHTYSRTKELLSEFATSFDKADCVLITDIYASAREKPLSGISGESLAEKILKNHSQVHYAPDRQAVIQYLGRFIRPNDIVITMGAGDIYQWIPGMLKGLHSL